MSLVESRPSPSRRKAYALRLLAISLLSVTSIAAMALAVSVTGSAQAATAEPPIGSVFHVGGPVTAPKALYAPDPKYTDQARKAKYQDTCIVSLIVDAQGNPRQVRVVRHVRMGLDQKALEAVRRYKFSPAMAYGKPVAVEVNIEVNFRLR